MVQKAPGASAGVGVNEGEGEGLGVVVKLGVGDVDCAVEVEEEDEPPDWRPTPRPTPRAVATMRRRANSRESHCCEQAVRQYASAFAGTGGDGAALEIMGPLGALVNGDFGALIWGWG